MSKFCPPAPADKKKYIRDIGKILVQEHGKQKYYKPEQVKKAHRKSDWFDGLDFSDWGMSTFCDRSDFDAYYFNIGENFDYVAMKTEMLSGLSSNANAEWLNITDLDIDASWLEAGDFFDGIGDFFSSIFDGL